MDVSSKPAKAVDVFCGVDKFGSENPSNCCFTVRTVDESTFTIQCNAKEWRRRLLKGNHTKPEISWPLCHLGHDDIKNPLVEC
jgi:hypothetical protein